MGIVAAASFVRLHGRHGMTRPWTHQARRFDNASAPATSGDDHPAYYRVVDAVKSVLAIENVRAAIDQIAQTTLRKVVGQHSLDQTLAETETINLDIRKILDAITVDWGVEVTLVELKDIQLPDSMKRAMARQAEAEREKRAKIINAEGELPTQRRTEFATVAPWVGSSGC